MFIRNPSNIAILFLQLERIVFVPKTLFLLHGEKDVMFHSLLNRTVTVNILLLHPTQFDVCSIREREISYTWFSGEAQ